MAYMSQEKKQSLTPIIKSILKKYNINASISVHHQSTLRLKIKSGKIDFIKDYNYDPISTGYIQVNNYHLDTNFKEGKAQLCLTELNDAMNIGNFDNSDPQSDYFHCGWYTSIHIGDWDKPYQFIP